MSARLTKRQLDLVLDAVKDERVRKVTNQYPAKFVIKLCAEIAALRAERDEARKRCRCCADKSHEVEPFI